MLERYLNGMVGWLSATLGLISTGSKLIKDPPPPK